MRIDCHSAHPWRTGIVLLAVLLGPVATLGAEPPPRQAVSYMRLMMERVHPALAAEDPHCAAALPWAILQQARSNRLDWREIFVLAWQESNFDCHAKNRRDRGGSYGPFQIRRLWAPLLGDPRVRYDDPDLAVERVAKVLRYYRETDRHAELTQRAFRYPLLCLYNTGESRRVNLRYCEQIGGKMDIVRKGWRAFQAGRLVAENN
jgi:hypothetical protein